MLPLNLNKDTMFNKFDKRLSIFVYFKLVITNRGDVLDDRLPPMTYLLAIGIFAHFIGNDGGRKKIFFILFRIV